VLIEVSGSAAFENLIMLCILLNTILLAIYWVNIDEDILEVIEWGNLIFAIIFTLEAGLKIFALRSHYFK
jgi:hypothetical protein